MHICGAAVGKLCVIIETYGAQMDGKQSLLTYSVDGLCVFLVKLYAQEKKAQVHC